MFGTHHRFRCRDRRSFQPRPENLEERALLTATVINFDNLPASSSFLQGSVISAQAQLSNQLANQAVVFSTGLGANYVAVVPLGLGHATSGTNGISMAATDNTVTYDAPDYTVIDFVDPSNPSVA